MRRWWALWGLVAAACARGAAEAPDAGEALPDAAAASRDAAAPADAAARDAASSDAAPRCDDLPFQSLPLCTKNAGVCAGARERCEDGRAAACAAADYAAYHVGYVETETGAHCDGLDNDC